MSKLLRRGYLSGIPALLAGLACLAALPASAHSIDTIKKIADSGTINIGHRESSLPFSYYDNSRKVVGYSHDLTMKVVEAIRSELKLGSLTIKLVPVTAQNRLALVQNGSVDLECASTTHNTERGRAVTFSVSFFRIGTRLMTSPTTGIHDFPDLAGRRLVVTSGTTSEKLIRLYNERHGRKISILVARDHGESFAMLESQKADAFMMDDALLYGERMKSDHPERWIITGTPLSSEVYGCMMRKGDLELKRMVDTVLVRLMRGGEAMRLHHKWFQGPIPPKGLNLNWPPSPELVELFNAPNDRALDGR